MSSKEVRGKLDNWKFWVVVAYIALALVVAGLWGLYGRTAKEEAARTANAKAAAVAQVNNCFQQVKNSPVIAGLVDSIELVITNSIVTTEATIKATPAPPQLTVVREQSLVRLHKSLVGVKKFIRLLRSNTPTEKKCVELSKNLNVNLAGVSRK